MALTRGRGSSGTRSASWSCRVVPALGRGVLAHVDLALQLLERRRTLDEPIAEGLQDRERNERVLVRVKALRGVLEQVPNEFWQPHVEPLGMPLLLRHEPGCFLARHES